MSSRDGTKNVGGNPNINGNGIWRDNNGESTESQEDDDDYYVYTYKGGNSPEGGNLADLPSSFFKFHPSECQPGPSSRKDGSSDSDPNKTSVTNGVTCVVTNGNGHSCGSLSFNPPLGCISTNQCSGRNSFHGGEAENFSPDMDFLEMDFDPGGTGDDSENMCDSESSQNGLSSEVDMELHVHENNTNQERILSGNFDFPSDNGDSSDTFPQLQAVAGCSKNITAPLNSQASLPQPSQHPCSYSKLPPDKNQNWRPLLVENSNNNSNINPSVNGVFSDHSSSGPSRPSPMFPDLRPARDFLKLVKSNTLPELNPVSKTTDDSLASHTCSLNISHSAPLFPQNLLNSRNKDSIEVNVGGVMIWSVEEANRYSFSQIGKSACGATAVLNVLSALGYHDRNPTFVNECVATRFRDESGEIPEYLFSRSNAGATHEDLISGISRASNEEIIGKFFRLTTNTTQRSLSKWLITWICKGAIPVVTRNLQIVPKDFKGTIPDSWHHQMIFGISEAGVFLCNPIECLPYNELLPQLCSPSELLVRREDIVKRKTPRTDLRRLARQTDVRWNDMNVLGQVANIFLEETPPLGCSSTNRRVQTSHVKIPAQYKAGITLFVKKDSHALAVLSESSYI